jgi:hypothetical protein
MDTASPSTGGVYSPAKISTTILSMVGTTLCDLRAEIESLAEPAGEYFIACARTGDRPVPATGHRFESREKARRGATATEQYRATLRQFDPQVPVYDLIVCQDTGPMVSPREVCDCSDSTRRPAGNSRWTLTDPVLERRSGADRQARPGEKLTEFCHEVAAAVFEALSVGGYEAVERAVMDAYLEHAETIDRRNDLCRCLLESLSSELEYRLGPDEQVSLFETAARRLEPAGNGDEGIALMGAIEESVARLSARGLLGEFQCGPASGARESASRRVQLECSTYALRERDGRLPVLPIVLELFRRDGVSSPTAVDVVTTDDGWRVTLELSSEVTPAGLAAAPVSSEP